MNAVPDVHAILRNVIWTKAVLRYVAKRVWRPCRGVIGHRRRGEAGAPVTVGTDRVCSLKVVMTTAFRQLRNHEPIRQSAHHHPLELLLLERSAFRCAVFSTFFLNFSALRAHRPVSFMMVPAVIWLECHGIVLCWG